MEDKCAISVHNESAAESEDKDRSEGNMERFSVCVCERVCVFRQCRGNS